MSKAIVKASMVTVGPSSFRPSIDIFGEIESHSMARCRENGSMPVCMCIAIFGVHHPLCLRGSLWHERLQIPRKGTLCSYIWYICIPVASTKCWSYRIHFSPRADSTQSKASDPMKRVTWLGMCLLETRWCWNERHGSCCSWGSSELRHRELLHY